MFAFKDIPIGAKLAFGTKEPSWQGSIRWKKVSDEFMLALDSPKTIQRHAPGDTYNNFYPDGNVHRWLQAEGGLLSYFSSYEQSLLTEFEIRCNVPRGLRKERGKVWKGTVKAALPSIDNFVSPGKLPIDWVAEDSRFPTTSRFSSVPTRSSSGTASFYTPAWSGGVTYHGKDRWVSPMPIVRPDPNSQWDMCGTYGVDFTLTEPYFSIEPSDLLAVLEL